MIKTVKLKFGRAPGLPAEEIETTPVTVFVGPNNSGKSLVLSEIYEFCQQGILNSLDVIIDHLEFEGLSYEKTDDAVSRITLVPRKKEALQPEHIIVGNEGRRQQLNRQSLKSSIEHPNDRPNRFCQWYLQYNTLMLDGKRRIILVGDQSAGDLQGEPNNSFQALFRDDEKRLQVRRIIHDAFSLYFVLDPTNLGQLRARLSERPPANHQEERGIHKEAVLFHSSAAPISEMSDGVKAFTGMITEIIAGDPDVILIDEPEAFLHPSLSFKLGKEISQASHGSAKRLFVSTHSASFVKGCIQSGAPTNIVRLTYRGGIATARTLPSDELLKLMRNPLLRSTGVLNGLFYEFVVVTESDTDRAFYEEINERLLRLGPDLGIPNCLFLNAQNKQTVHTILRPLRKLGIPAAGIVDIDIVKEGGAVWTNFLSGGFVPEMTRQSLATVRPLVKNKFEGTGKDMKRDGGVDLLEDEDREAANDLFDQLEEYGLFVVRGGEVESWLQHLGASGHGPTWLVDAFERMGEDPSAQGYLKPSKDDVWAFIGQVGTWLTSPTRKGIPT